MANAEEMVGIDWGTTHRRSYWLDGAGALVAEHGDDLGLLAAQGPGWFAQALDSALASFDGLPANAAVLMSGMVGSAQGWHAVPYLGLEVPLTELGKHLFQVPDAPGNRPCAIVPGYAMHAADGTVDVMRGEETQLLGALALAAQDGRRSDGWYVLPGTHSKWVRLRGGCIERFSTFMTGELYALLSKYGTLAPLMSPAVAVAPASAEESRAAFDAGLRAAAHGSLSNVLFGCRARVVAGVMPAAQAGDHVSGLLIGAEWHDALAREQAAGGHIDRVSVIGAPSLAERHRQAGAALGIEVALIDPRAAYLAALKRLGGSASA